MNKQVQKMWADPRFQIYADVLKLLEGSRMWGGMGWSYHYIVPEKYLPVRDQVRKALDDLKEEYSVEEKPACQHDWYSAKNPVVLNGSVCVKCGAIDPREPEELKNENQV